MSVEYTLSIIKPDGVRRNLIGKINTYFEEGGLEIAAQKMVLLTKDQVEKFYEIHKSRPFFNSLVESMVSFPVVIQVLKGEGAVAKNRKIMGATNPFEAEVGTIRRDLSESIDANTVHGSDSLENAFTEIEFFFSETEILR
ncbi:MAG UNVERIFIED_CONTAM: nucleoside-diphosphate kinase [Rickettsiaceae bacterium]|jgi:nucleoside-diphosphate kinase